MRTVIAILILAVLAGCASQGPVVEVETHVVKATIRGAWIRDVVSVLKDIKTGQGSKLVAENKSALKFSLADAEISPYSCLRQHGAPIREYKLKKIDDALTISVPIVVCRYKDTDFDSASRQFFGATQERLRNELTAVGKLWSVRYDQEFNFDFSLLGANDTGQDAMTLSTSQPSQHRLR